MINSVSTQPWSTCATCVKGIQLIISPSVYKQKFATQMLCFEKCPFFLICMKIFTACFQQTPFELSVCNVPCLTYSGVAFIRWVTVLCWHIDKYITADTVRVSSRDSTRVVPTRKCDDLLPLMVPADIFVSTS